MFGEFLSSFSNTCSPLFVTSALTSLFTGERQRTLQNATSEEQRLHREYLDAKRQEFEEHRFETDVRERRLSQERGRAYLAIEANRRLKNAHDLAEFQHFDKKCWPLTLDIATVWDIHRALNPAVPVPLTVMVARPNSDAIQFNVEYVNIINALQCDAKELGDIDVYSNPWKATVNNAGGLAQNMNIHHIMQGLPTLIITPQLIADKLCFDISVWSLGNGAVQHLSIFEMPYDKSDIPALKEKVKNVLLAITGSVRDSYVAIEHCRPATLPDRFAYRFAQYPDIQEQILAPQYGDLCKICEKGQQTLALMAPSERETVHGSLRNFIFEGRG